jgi:hypothetical protein
VNLAKLRTEAVQTAVADDVAAIVDRGGDARTARPGKVPRSMISPLRWRKAWAAPAAVAATPTTSPRLFNPEASLESPPSVPRSAIV